MKAKKTTAKRLDESRAKKNVSIARLREELMFSRNFLEELEASLQQARRELRTARRAAILALVATVAAAGSAVGLLLVVLTR